MQELTIKHSIWIVFFYIEFCAFGINKNVRIKFDVMIVCVTRMTRTTRTNGYNHQYQFDQVSDFWIGLDQIKFIRKIVPNERRMPHSNETNYMPSNVNR